MKKHVGGSIAIGIALCFLTAAGAAYAVTPESVIDDLFADSNADTSTATQIEPTYLIEHPAGAESADFISAYADKAGALKLAGPQPTDTADEPYDANAATLPVAASTTSGASHRVTTDDTSTTASAPTETPALTNDLEIGNQVIPYIAAYDATTAPARLAGIWAGANDVNDGSWTYFIGHHPGVFDQVMNLANGDAVTVHDGTSATRTYHVIEIFDVPDTTVWEEIAPEVTSHGESIVLQTCCGDDAHYRIVIAA